MRLSTVCVRANLTTLFTIFIKEMRDALRDRRTLLTLLISSILVGPVALFLVVQFVADLDQRAASRQLVVAGLEHAPHLENFLARNHIEARAAPDEFRQALRDGKLREAVMVLKPDFQTRLARGESLEIELVYDDTRNQTLVSVRVAESILQAYGQEIGMTRLLARGIDPRSTQAVRIARTNLASPRQQAAFLFFLIPMFALLGAVMGGMSLAIDATAGERERGSLEPLLGNPIRPEMLVAGKWLATACWSGGIVFFILCGFALTANLLPSERLAALFQFGPAELLRFLAIMLPFAGMVAALQMLVATFGRSYKEAQTYASYIALLINFVPLVTLMAGVDDADWQRFVPALGQQMVMASMLRGETLSAFDYLAPLVTAVALTTLFLLGIARLLRMERIIFGRT